MRAAAYRYIGASFSLLPFFVLSPCRKASPSRTEKKSSRGPTTGACEPWMGRALGGTVWGPGWFLFPLVPKRAWRPRYLHKPRRGKRPLMPSVPVTSWGKRCRDFNQFTSPPDVSGLIKPPPHPPAGPGRE